MYQKRVLWWIRTTVYSLFIAVMLGMGLYAYVVLRWPDAQILEVLSVQGPVRIYDKDQHLLAQWGGSPYTITQDQIPKRLMQAVVSAEDRRFFDHVGVDVFGVMRAAKTLLMTGEKRQGGSTLTMQLARNYFLHPRKTFIRKFHEIWLAIRIEQNLSKETILALYLNKVFLGHGAYGFQAAAHVYYGKALSELSLAQIATLAGLPKAPSRINPITSPERARQRRHYVLRAMRQEGYISQEAYEKAAQAPITASYHGFPRVPKKAAYPVDLVQEALLKRYGKQVSHSGWRVYTTISWPLQQAAHRSLASWLMRYAYTHGYRRSGLGVTQPFEEAHKAWYDRYLRKVHVPEGLQAGLVTQVQADRLWVYTKEGHEILVPWAGIKHTRAWIDGKRVGQLPAHASDRAHVGELVYLARQEAGPSDEAGEDDGGDEGEDRERWQLVSLPPLEGALVTLNPQNGAVMALIGGFDHGLSPFNRAVKAWRQPGSAIKPLVYAAALQAKDQRYTLASLINDAPIVEKGSGAHRWWRPQNHEKSFSGPMRVRLGLMLSKNLMALRLLRDIGIPYTRDYLGQLGLDPSKQPLSLSLALGTGLVTPLQLTAAYAAFANGGYRIYPYLIDRIEDAHGHLVYEAHPRRVPQTPDEILEAYAEAGHRGHQAWWPFGGSKSQDKVFYATRVMDARVSYLMDRVLQDVVHRGTAQKALSLRRPDVAGKTGSTNQYIDAWFVGYQHHMVTGVWLGDDHNRPVGLYGSQAALPVWIDFMKQALKHQPVYHRQPPAGLVRVPIDTMGRRWPMAQAAKRQKSHPASVWWEWFRVERLADLPWHTETALEGEEEEVSFGFPS